VKVTSSAELQSLSSSPVGHIALSEDLDSVPRAILERAPQVKILDLSGNRLSALPDWIAQLSQLEIIFLSFNQFSQVPQILGQLPRLRMIGMRGNQIESVPPEALPPSLEWLTLTNNLITKLPSKLGRIPRLRKLLLAGNRLQSLPESFREAQSLEVLRLSANRFDYVPEWLFTLPSLAWLALAGNPCTRRSTEVQAPDPISWKDLTIGAELGRGASGQTFQATLTNSNSHVESVAVKVFATQVSSDGEGDDEIAAAVAAGRHPNLVSTRSTLRDHPKGCAGLVLDLIPVGFRNLASPPSFQSCSRDVYPNSPCFSAPNVLSYARGVAAAAHHLHSRGIMHGDLYGHNILVSSDHVLVSDFGAACIYQGNSVLDSAMLERIEVRAYGILLHELLAHTAKGAPPQHNEKLQALQQLADNCCSANVAARPGLSEILSLCSASEQGS
jgi:hypothetical protein